MIIEQLCITAAFLQEEVKEESVHTTVHGSIQNER